MPNIEIHGLRPEIHDIKKANELQRKIWSLLEDAKYFDDAVVSYGNIQVTSAGGDTQPYLRIWTTDESDRNDIVRRLEPLDIGIELPPLLDRYIPSKTEQEVARAKLLSLQPVAGTDKNFDYVASAADDGSDKLHVRKGTGHIDES